MKRHKRNKHKHKYKYKYTSSAGDRKINSRDRVKNSIIKDSLTELSHFNIYKSFIFLHTGNVSHLYNDRQLVYLNSIGKTPREFETELASKYKTRWKQKWTNDKYNNTDLSKYGTISWTKSQKPILHYYIEFFDIKDCKYIIQQDLKCKSEQGHRYPLFDFIIRDPYLISIIPFEIICEKLHFINQVDSATAKKTHQNLYNLSKFPNVLTRLIYAYIGWYI